MWISYHISKVFCYSVSHAWRY